MTDPLDDLLARAAPDVPPDAAERVLARLDPVAVARQLAEGELEAAVRPALRASLALFLASALVVLAALARELHGAHGHGPHGQGGRHDLTIQVHHGEHGEHGELPPATDDALVLAGRALRDARRFAAPVPLEEK